MARLYCPKESIQGEEIFINDPRQIHYLCDVLRMKVKDDIYIFDGQGKEYRCKIEQLSKKRVTLTMKEENKNKVHSQFNLTVACSLPKQKNRFDDLIDKLSQLGVDKIIPMITQRVVVRWDYSRIQRHHHRWEKIAQQACIQSGRNVLPVIEPIKEIRQILNSSESYDLKLIPTITEEKHNLRDIVNKTLILIGPEGDFTEGELAQAVNAGFIPICLGDLVLRVDTAAIAVASFFRLSGVETYGAKRS
jgi:16S rRNA (uracil1498-N3)-methyltransferase